MKHVMKWLGKVLGTAVSLVLVVVLLPYASKWCSTLLPD